MTQHQPCLRLCQRPLRVACRTTVQPRPAPP
uniref:Uncharacterized protein n=1 Tax=Macrostomum lignano TaxID=282301 RepID=A0A1I8FG34_9PLAT